MSFNLNPKNTFEERNYRDVRKKIVIIQLSALSSQLSAVSFQQDKDDHLSFEVNQRPAAVAGVDRRVCLKEIVIRS